MFISRVPSRDPHASKLISSMADLDAELALFESEISSLVADPGPSPKKKKKTDPVEEVKEANGPEVTSNGAVISAPPAVSVSPAVPVIAAAPMLQTFSASTVMAPFLSPVPGVIPPPVPPPIFVHSQAFRTPPAFPIPMPTIFLPHQLRQAAPKHSATIESAPKIYNADPSTSNVAVGQSSTAPVTFALASDIEAMEKKNEHPSAPSSTRVKDSKPSKPKKYLRAGGGQVWEDPSLAEWDKNDFRIFCGDLGNEVSDELLAKAFRKYPSFQKAKVVRDSRSNKSKGYGFVSFTESDDYVRAMREMDGKYVGNRPIKLRKSNWKERNLDVVKKKQKQKAKLGLWS
ncbi:hypothetical protein Angca_009790 [Angiostrongylus cantonensis]|nr:hypothetical protein Angca_009790 [Angiostrongylus cantonensis]